MEAISNTPQVQPLFSSQDSAPADKTTPALSSDFETFLKMLTVQMQNQDPLNPVDSADYAVQLATFSSVEQQVLTNELLTTLASTMSGGGIGALGQWVGMDVRAGQTALFDGSQIEIAVQINPEADRHVLVVRDETGATVTRQDISNTESKINWDGTLSNGQSAAQGIYEFEIESFKNGAVLSREPATPYSRVREAILENGQTMLRLEGDILVSPSDVSALRDPD